jgi:hypothetical protein
MLWNLYGLSEEILRVLGKILYRVGRKKNIFFVSPSGGRNRTGLFAPGLESSILDYRLMKHWHRFWNCRIAKLIGHLLTYLGEVGHIFHFVSGEKGHVMSVSSQLSRIILLYTQNWPHLGKYWTFGWYLFPCIQNKGTDPRADSFSQKRFIHRLSTQHAM